MSELGFSKNLNRHLSHDVTNHGTQMCIDEAERAESDWQNVWHGTNPPEPRKEEIESQVSSCRMKQKHKVH